LVNEPFKDYLKKEYEAWLLSDNLPLTSSCKIKRESASWEEYCQKNSGTVVPEMLPYKCT
jgi:hypothetical protein